MDTFTFKNGTEVQLKKVRTPALRHLILQTGIRVSDPKELERIQKLPLEEQMRALGMDEEGSWKISQASERLFSYLAGWGVIDNPSSDERQELVDMGLSADTDRSARASWVRYMLIEDEDEAAQFVAAVIGFMGQKDQPENGNV